MKRLFIALPLCFIAFMSLAQTQRGYVKTLGRPEKAGQPLEGVVILFQGYHNHVISDDKGDFSLLMNDKKNGDAYSLQQVQKSGYELNESDLVGRKLAFSDQVPLVIVMASTEQLQADKQRIEDNAYAMAQRNHAHILDSLQQQLQTNAITQEQYRSQMDDIQKKFENFQLLIDGLAAHYAHTDYDFLNEKDREINICIENGELERADSLIHILFDPINVLERFQKTLANLDQQIAQAKDIIDQANSDLAVVLEQQKKDAEYLYQLYTIALARFDKSNARYYIETRAALDTANILWQKEASEFLRIYYADYPKVIEYEHRILRYVLTNYDELHPDVASAYELLGVTYLDQGSYENALEYLNKSLELRTKAHGENDPELSTSYNNIGCVYNFMGDPDKSLEYFQKALELELIAPVRNDLSIASDYNNLSAVYWNKGQSDIALEYLLKSLNLRLSVLGENNLQVAGSYNNIGQVYIQLKDLEKASDYINKSLNVRLKLLGEKHPDVADTYNVLGNISYMKKDYEKALDYYNKALNIWILGQWEFNRTPAMCHKSMGQTYVKLDNFAAALEHFNRALEISIAIFGENHPLIAGCYNKTGFAYYKLGQLDKALEHYQKSLKVYEETLPADDPLIGKTKENIAKLQEEIDQSKKE